MTRNLQLPTESQPALSARTIRGRLSHIMVAEDFVWSHDRGEKKTDFGDAPVSEWP